MPLRSVAHSGPTSCPSAPPRGLAREAIAVVDTRPLSENQVSLYLVGAQRTNGWEKPLSPLVSGLGSLDSKKADSHDDLTNQDKTKVALRTSTCARVTEPIADQS